MSTLRTAKVTLFDAIEYTVRTDDALVVAEDCYDIADKTLNTRTIKHISKGTVVVVKDISTAIIGARIIRAYSGNTLYYLAPNKLKPLSKQ